MRPCYHEILEMILDKRNECNVNRWTQGIDERPTLFVIRGSTGIGKSTFLSFVIGCTRHIFKNFALFYSGNDNTTPDGQPISSEVFCHVMHEGKVVLHGYYADVNLKLRDSYLSKMDLILMDGCSMPLGATTRFKGVLIVAASPSLYVGNLTKIIVDQCFVTMPALELQESYEIADIIEVGHNVVDDNWRYMGGITRYLFEPGFAKEKVDQSLSEVNTSTITQMMSMQQARGETNLMVHSLVLWKTGTDLTEDPKFELVSPYVEKMVAKKLARET